ncbi:MAG: hypothetical protein IJK74_06610 [Bacteroidales bacterium]|nr:hypothetical protein [Bacteroidales bacterium]
MAYYSSNSSSSGCLAPLVILAIVGIVGLCSHLKENSQSSMIKSARNQRTESSKQDKYIDYLLKHPNGKYSSEAETFIIEYLDKKSNVKEIETASRQLKGTYFSSRIDSLYKATIDMEYNYALSEGTVEGWKLYKRKVPSEYWRDAESRIDSIEHSIEETNWGTESAAWQTAQKDNTVYAYNKYLDLYPKGKHARAADKKIIDISVSNIFDGDHGFLPDMGKTYSNSSNTNVITVTNKTSYTLTILYSGPDSRRLVIGANSVGSITLPNGTYRVAASVSASNVRSYAGTEILTGGGYEASYYISSGTYYR